MATYRSGVVPSPTLPHLFLLVLLALLLCLLPAAVSENHNNLSWSRSAEYYHRRYQGRPRRGPVPLANTTSSHGVEDGEDIVSARNETMPTRRWHVEELKAEAVPEGHIQELKATIYKEAIVNGTLSPGPEVILRADSGVLQKREAGAFLANFSSSAAKLKQALKTASDVHNNLVAPDYVEDVSNYVTSNSVEDVNNRLVSNSVEDVVNTRPEVLNSVQFTIQDAVNHLDPTNHLDSESRPGSAFVTENGYTADAKFIHPAADLLVTSTETAALYRAWANHKFVRVLREPQGRGDALQAVQQAAQPQTALARITSLQLRRYPLAGLPVLTLLRFSNDACGSEEDGGRGTCLLPSECSAHGGTAVQPCARGFGVCCVQTETCGGETRGNNTYFVHPEYPAAGRAVRACVLTVHKAASDVTQIRLDLAQFQLAGPTSGTCKRDVFSVSGQDVNSIVPPLCGNNDGQHLYLEVGERTGPVQLRVVTSASSEHRWRVRITQLLATDPARAPPLCLQYHTGRTGQISSFNYLSNVLLRPGGPVDVPRPARPADGIGYMNNLNYVICIRKESGFCSITYSTDNFGQQAMANEFNIVNFENEDSDGGIDPRIVTSAGGGTPTVPAGQAGVGPVKCRHDFLVLSVDRLCGDRLNDAAASSTLTDNADVTDLSAGPFAVRFYTNQRRTGLGFRLDFRQNPCSSQPYT